MWRTGAKTAKMTIAPSMSRIRDLLRAAMGIVRLMCAMYASVDLLVHLPVAAACVQRLAAARGGARRLSQ